MSDYERTLHDQGLCAEIVPVMTEDGLSDGRCMRPITDHQLAACASHAEERRHWMRMSEPERAAWERAIDSTPPRWDESYE